MKKLMMGIVALAMCIQTAVYASPEEEAKSICNSSVQLTKNMVSGTVMTDVGGAAARLKELVMYANKMIVPVPIDGDWNNRDSQKEEKLCNCFAKYVKLSSDEQKTIYAIVGVPSPDSSWGSVIGVEIRYTDMNLLNDGKLTFETVLEKYRNSVAIKDGCTFEWEGGLSNIFAKGEKAFLYTEDGKIIFINQESNQAGMMAERKVEYLAIFIFDKKQLFAYADFNAKREKAEAEAAARAKEAADNAAFDSALDF